MAESLKLDGAPMKCKRDGCEKHPKIRGYCRKHYQSAREIGEIGCVPCSKNGCSKNAVRRGFCNGHYIAERWAGRVGAVRCGIAGCDAFTIKGDRCYRHTRWRQQYGMNDVEIAKVHRDPFCSICRSPAKTIDHCHVTGKFRGLLCDNCNKGIGMMRDNPKFLRAAADYLERTK